MKLSADTSNTTKGTGSRPAPEECGHSGSPAVDSTRWIPGQHRWHPRLKDVSDTRGVTHTESQPRHSHRLCITHIHILLTYHRRIHRLTGTYADST